MLVIHQYENFPSVQECRFPHDTFSYLLRRHYITDVTSDQDRSFCKDALGHFCYQLSRKFQFCSAISIYSMTSLPLVTATSLTHAGSFLAHDQTLDKAEHFCFVFQRRAIVPPSTCKRQTKALLWEINNSAIKVQ